ncbi:NUDIX hydrolase [Halorussus halophilus]|uniref:NUDIX hydrolase n=1 Tax=Halorussus halophilus TaxID=2650975 RepID=UPI0013016712|nr:NUDIX domain-containing protein [Halorussus halophilus]
MNLGEKTRTDVDARIDQFREKYGEFELVERTVENDPEYFEHGRELAQRGWRGDACTWVRSDDGSDRLFIRHPEAPKKWGIPGGTHQGDESFEDTARREVREETGLDCEITNLWRVVRRTIVLETNPEKRLHVLTTQFEGRADGDSSPSATGDDEILEARWFDKPPASVHEFLESKVRAWADGH